MLQRRRALGGLALLFLVAAGCARPVEPGGQGPGGRRQPLALTPRQELAVGRQAYREVMDEARGRLLPADDPRVQRVHKVLDRLVRAAEIEPLQDEILLRIRGYAFEWQANVIRDPQVNAFCLPAGKIFVFTGILQVIGRDDGYLAAVLAHEMAHALAHHASERVWRQQHEGGSVLRALRYDRLQESEADHIGVFLMAFAGYDPEKAVEFWRRMSQARGARGEPLEFLSDHPSHATRIRQLQRWAPAARAAKRAFDQGRIAGSRRRARVEQGDSRTEGERP